MFQQILMIVVKFNVLISMIMEYKNIVSNGHVSQSLIQQSIFATIGNVTKMYIHKTVTFQVNFHFYNKDSVLIKLVS